MLRGGLMMISAVSIDRTHRCMQSVIFFPRSFRATIVLWFWLFLDRNLASFLAWNRVHIAIMSGRSVAQVCLFQVPCKNIRLTYLTVALDCKIQERSKKKKKNCAYKCVLHICDLDTELNCNSTVSFLCKFVLALAHFAILWPKL